MLRVILSSDNLNTSHFFDVVKDKHSEVEIEAFVISNKNNTHVTNVDRYNIPDKHNRQVDKIFNSFDRHMLIKAKQDIINQLMTNEMHVYYLR